MREREILLSSRMEKRRRAILVPIYFVLGTLILSAMFYSVFAKYQPPKHDDSAMIGFPNPDEGYLFGKVATEYGYSVAMAANLYRQLDGSVNIFFTNAVANQVYLRFDIVDRDTSKVLYKSGYVKPGEYIESVRSSKAKNKHYDVIVKVYAYTPDKFTSEGTTEIALMLQPW